MALSETGNIDAHIHARVTASDHDMVEYDRYDTSLTVIRTASVLRGIHIG